MLVVYNTLSNRKEPFEPLEPGKVRMYVCGITVYDLCHLGHARMVLAFEEAFGVTIGDSRDKDGIISCLLAAHCAADGGIGHWLKKMYETCGYAAEDLFLRPAFQAACDDAVKTVARELAGLKDMAVVVGHPTGGQGKENKRRTKHNHGGRFPIVFQTDWRFASGWRRG